MATFEVTLFPSSPSMSSDVGDVGVHAQVRRHECARDRRLRRLRSEARLRLRLVRDTVLLCSHRGGPFLRAEHGEMVKKLEGEFGTFQVEVANKFNDMQDALTASGARLELLVAGAEKSGSCLVSSLQDALGKLEEKVDSYFSSSRDVESALRDSLGILEENFDARCSAVLDDVRNVSDVLREADRSLDAKLTKEVVARRSMREHLIGSLRDEGSSRVDLEQRFDELTSSFQFVAERVDVIDTWLDSRFGQS